MNNINNECVYVYENEEDIMKKKKVKVNDCIVDIEPLFQIKLDYNDDYGSIIYKASSSSNYLIKSFYILDRPYICKHNRKYRETFYTEKEPSKHILNKRDFQEFIFSLKIKKINNDIDDSLSNDDILSMEKYLKENIM